MSQMLSFNMCEGQKKIWHHFGLFLRFFLAFHLKFLRLCKKPPSYISGTHKSLFPLVNNGQIWCQNLCTFFHPYWSFRGSVGTFPSIGILCTVHTYTYMKQNYHSNCLSVYSINENESHNVDYIVKFTTYVCEAIMLYAVGKFEAALNISH